MITTTEKYLNESMINRSIANEGDKERLRSLFERAATGEKLTIAFLGGSITQGCLSSRPETCYAYLVYDWFVRTFPQSDFVYVNAGIGGTTSQFAAARLDEDVLAYRPDFCMVEFSVNDSDNVFFKETYESVVSRLLESGTKPAVMIMHNLFYETGRNAQKQHLSVGKAYGVPCVSVRDAVYPEIEAGRIKISQLSSDGLHPNDDGHAVLAELVISRLENILRQKTEDVQKNESEEHTYKPRITPDAYCTIKRIQNGNTGVTCRGFLPDNTPKENMLDIFKSGWKASKTGDEIEFTFTGTELGIQYRKTIRRPAPVAVAIIDGDEEHPVILDANFEEDWGDSLHIDTLLYHGHRVDPAKMYGDFETLRFDNGSDGIERRCMPPAKHTIKIRIIETHEDDREVFYLVSFIAG
ncbi:MAG: SGNH/GDSL hydrolase family protein [Lachnospiraceae bacterium]|nr:SGNH/GDSL hydrolase family protein [Lachnospiraceae bacterium]